MKFRAVVKLTNGQEYEGWMTNEHPACVYGQWVFTDDADQVLDPDLIYAVMITQASCHAPPLRGTNDLNPPGTRYYYYVPQWDKPKKTPA